MCVIFHNKSAKKKKMHVKPLAQFKFSVNKVIVGFVNVSLKMLSWTAKLGKTF